MNDQTNPTQPKTVCDTCSNCDVANRCKNCGGCTKIKAMTDAEKATGGCMCNPCTCVEPIPTQP